MLVFTEGQLPEEHGPCSLNLLGALPSPALHAKSHLISTLEEDNFEAGELSGHL